MAIFPDALAWVDCRVVARHPGDGYTIFVCHYAASCANAERRATLVRFTEAGGQFLRDAHAIKRELVAEYAVVLGAQRLEALRTALATLVAHERQRG